MGQPPPIMIVTQPSVLEGWNSALHLMGGEPCRRQIDPAHGEVEEALEPLLSAD